MYTIRMVTRKQKLFKPCKTRRVKYAPNADFNKDTRALMLYIASRNYIKANKVAKRFNTPDSILSDALGYLHDEHYMYGLSLIAYADCEKLPFFTMKHVREILKKALTKKYLERPSPSFPAGMLCGYLMCGNDGRSYRSVKTRTGCVWKPVDEQIPYL